MIASVLAEVATIALVIGVIVSCTTILVMVLGVSSARPDRRPAQRHLGPPPTPIARPSAALAAARARAIEAARAEQPPPGPTGPIPAAAVEVPSPPVAPEPLALPAAPAGRIDHLGDGRLRAVPGTIEEVRAVVDHLVETNPRLLAEVITQWIRNDAPTPPHTDGARPGSRLDRLR
jgi:hypothetical protein